MPDVFPHRGDGAGEMDAVFYRPLYEVEHQAQGCLFANSGQGGESVYGFFD